MESDICILSISGEDQVQCRLPYPGIAGTGVVAWSPLTWDCPHLLCIACSGEALFFDCKAALKGKCEDPLQGEVVWASYMTWVQNGVAVITDKYSLGNATLRLFDVRSGSSGLLLESRLQLSMPSVYSFVPSPDQAHLCMMQCKHAPGIDANTLVLLNVVSGSQALIRLPEHLSRNPQPRWTSSGYSLAVPLVMEE